MHSHCWQPCKCEQVFCAGDSISMDRLYRAHGWEPVSISEVQWQQLTSLEEQQAFLRSKLLSCKA